MKLSVAVLIPSFVASSLAAQCIPGRLYCYDQLTNQRELQAAIFLIEMINAPLNNEGAPFIEYRLPEEFLFSCEPEKTLGLGINTECGRDRLCNVDEQPEHKREEICLDISSSLIKTRTKQKKEKIMKDMLERKEFMSRSPFRRGKTEAEFEQWWTDGRFQQ